MELSSHPEVQIKRTKKKKEMIGIAKRRVPQAMQDIFTSNPLGSIALGN